MPVPNSLVHALVEFGLTELDAWNCVHHAAGAAAAGAARDSLVLLRCEPGSAAGTAVDDPFGGVSPEQIAAAVEHGVAWHSAGPGQWVYLQRLDWCIEQLGVLNEDLSRLAEMLARREPAGTQDLEPRP